MQHLRTLVFAAVLVLACGYATARFGADLFKQPFRWNWRIAFSRYFWLGILLALIFLYSEYRFDHIHSLTHSL